MKTAPKELTTDQLAYMWATSKVSIAAWSKDWLFPAKVKRGKFDANIAHRLFVENQVIPKYVKPDDGTESTDSAKRRKEIALANIKEMQEAETRGELIQKDDAIKWVGGLVAEAKQRFIALPRRLAPVLYGKDIRDIENDIRLEVNRILSLLARPLKQKKP
jgi:hypothetical protein